MIVSGVGVAATSAGASAPFVPDLAERRVRARRLLRTTDGGLLPFRFHRPVEHRLWLEQ